MVLLMLLAAHLPIAASAASQESASKVLRVRMPYYPDTLDPQTLSFSEEASVVALEYEGLTRLDERLQTVPAAAESWQFNDDGTVLTFHLRQNLTYADGSPLTAGRFRDAIERACDPATAAVYAFVLFEIAGCEALFTGVTPGTPAAESGTPRALRDALGVRAIDERTLEMHLTHPAPYFPAVVSLPITYPVQREAIALGAGWWRDPANRVGNGPFRMTRLDEDLQISFAANERYWAGRPNLDGIDYLYVEDPSIALAAYQAGDVHITQVGPAQIPEVEADPNLTRDLVRYPLAVTVALLFNLGQAPFDDAKVREAFATGFDRETYCAELRNGDCEPTLSWIPPGVAGDAPEAFAFDAERALQALAASTYGAPENLPEITFAFASDDPAETGRAEWIAAQYRDVLGVEIRLDPVDAMTLAARTHESATFPQMTLLGWGQDYPDPRNWLTVFWACDSTIYAGVVGYCNESFDRLVTRADQELDAAERAQLYVDAEQVLLTDAPAVFIFNPAALILVSPLVRGYVPTPSDTFYPGQWASLLTLDLIDPAQAD
jgi:oligopeptide transport system substrate-binding protein